MSRITGDEPVVADDRDHTMARFSVIASAMPGPSGTNYSSHSEWLINWDPANHPCPAGFNNHVGRVDTVHFGSALLLHGVCCLENSSFPCAEGFSADAGRSAQAAS